jgi:CRP/FNR family transcriptional regulator, anaerobic regulatory protein
MAVTSFKMKQLANFLVKYIDLSPQEVLSIAGLVRHDIFKKHSHWLEEAKVSDTVGLILKGYARTYYFDYCGRESTSHFDWEFDLLVSPSSFFGRRPAECNIIAMEEMHVLYIHYDDLMNLLEQHPRLEGIVKDLLRDNIPDVSQHTKLLQMVSAQDRYEQFIHSRPDIVMRVPQKHIASYLGMTTETLSRVRARMKQ